MAKRVFCLVLILQAAALSGCKSTPQPPATLEEPTRSYLYPNKVHTGVSAGAEFLAILATNLPNPQFAVLDPTIAMIMPVAAPGSSTDTFVLLRAIAAGQTTVIARSGDKDVESDIIVTAYTPQILATGSARYNNPENANDTDRRACASCHQQAGGADHSPFIIGGFSDRDILQAITTGVYAHSEPLFLTDGEPHMWDLTDEEQEAIVPFLRTLRPRGF